MGIFDIFKKREKPGMPRVRYVPVLRDYDGFKDIVVHQKISDDLGLFAARLNINPDGSLFIDYVMKRELADYKITEEDMMQRCLNEFETGEFEGLENEKGEVYYYLAGMACCTSVIGLPETYETFKEWLGSENVIVGIANPDCIMITAQGSGFEDHIMEQVRQSDYMGAVALTPSVFLWNSEGLTVLYRKEYENEPEE